MGLGRPVIWTCHTDDLKETRVEDAGRSSSKARGPHSRHDLAVNSPTWLDVHAGALTREVRDSQMEAAQQPGLHFHDLRVRELGDAERGHPATPAMTMRYAQLSPDYLRTAVGRLDNVLAVSARQDAHKTQRGATGNDEGAAVTRNPLS